MEFKTKKDLIDFNWNLDKDCSECGRDKGLPRPEHLKDKQEHDVEGNAYLSEYFIKQEDGEYRKFFTVDCEDCFKWRKDTFQFTEKNYDLVLKK